LITIMKSNEQLGMGRLEDPLMRAFRLESQKLVDGKGRLLLRKGGLTWQRVQKGHSERE
jgi:hypothetical protein